jgi:hypothetical protein
MLEAHGVTVPVQVLDDQEHPTLPVHIVGDVSEPQVDAVPVQVSVCAFQTQPAPAHEVAEWLYPQPKVCEYGVPMHVPFDWHPRQ